MDAAIIDNGIRLMLYGMGMVFVFLTVLIFCTSLMSHIISTFLPEPEPVESTVSANMQTDQKVNSRTLAVIKAALDQHRSSNR